MKSKLALLLALTVLILGFVVLKPKPSTTNNPSKTQTKTFVLVVKNRKLVSGNSTLKANQDDSVVIKITANEDEELHLHGYDKMVDLTKGQPAELKFTANLSGNFP